MPEERLGEADLLRLVQEKTPAELTVAEIDALRAALPSSPALRQALAHELRLDSALAAALGQVSFTVDDLGRRSPLVERESALLPIAGLLGCVLFGLMLVGVAVSLFLPAPRPRENAERANGGPKSPAALLAANADNAAQADNANLAAGAKSPANGQATSDGDPDNKPSADKIPAAAAPAKTPVETKAPAEPVVSAPPKIEFPVIVPGEKFARGNVAVDKAEWGDKDTVVVLTDAGQGPGATHVEYEVTLPRGGEFELRLRYASFDSRPVKLTINGQEQPGWVAGEQTGGNSPSSQKWMSAGVRRFAAGKNVVRFETRGRFPHLNQLAVADPAQAPPRVAVVAEPGKPPIVKPSPIHDPPPVVNNPPALKPPPWAAVLAEEGAAPPFLTTAFEEFDFSKSLPRRADLIEWFAPVEGQRFNITELRVGRGLCGAFDGWLRLKAPLGEGRPLLLALENHNRLRIHLYSGARGVTLVYHEDRNQAWTAYATTRVEGRPRPETLALAATDEGRGRRAELRYGGPVALHWAGGELALTRGEVVLLRAPLAHPPAEVFLEGRAVVQGIQLVRGAAPPATPPEAAVVHDWDKPAALAWQEQLAPGARFLKHADGSVELEADNATGRVHVALPLPTDGVYQVAFEVSRAAPGAGLFFSRGDGQPGEVLRVARDGDSKARCVAALDDNDQVDVQLGDPLERPVTHVGDTFHVRAWLGAGVLKWQVSPDGVHWAFGRPRGDHPGGFTHLGVQCVANQQGCGLRLRRVAFQAFPRLRELAPGELVARAPRWADLDEFEPWLERLDAARPADVDLAAWRRAGALRQLAGGTSHNLGWRLVETLVDDPAVLAWPAARQVELLVEGAALLDLDDNASQSNLYFRRFSRAARVGFERDDARPFSLVRDPLMRLPLGGDYRCPTCDPELLWMEFTQLLTHGRWSDAAALCDWLRFHKQHAPHENLARFVESTAWRQLPRRPGDASPPPPRADWQPTLTEELDKETYNLVAELRAALESDALDDAARLITRVDARRLPGLAPWGGDDQLLVSYPGAWLLARRAFPELQAVLRDKFSNVGELRLRQAAAVDDIEGVRLAAMQFANTPAGGEARRWLGDRALASGAFAQALAEYQVARAQAPNLEAELAPRARLASAMLGVDHGPPAAGEVALGEARFTALEFEALVAEMRRRAADGGVVSLASEAPPASGLRSQVRARLDGLVGERPAEEVAPSLNAHDVDWVSRQIAAVKRGERLYVSNRFQVAAYNLATGERLWQTAKPGEAAQRSRDWPLVPMPPVFHGGRGFVRLLYGAGQQLACFNDSNGHTVWSHVPSRGESLVSDPFVLHGRLFALGMEPLDRVLRLRLLEFEAHSGKILASTPLAQAREHWNRRRHCAVVVADDLFIAALGGFLIAADTRGDVRWLRKEVSWPHEVDPTWVRQAFEPPLLHEGRLYVCQPGSRSLQAIDPATGGRFWARAVNDLERVLGVAHGKLLTQTRAGLQAHDAATGALAWKTPVDNLLEGRLLGGDRLIVSCAAAKPDEPRVFVPRLLWVDPRSGEPRGAASLPELAAPQPRLSAFVEHQGALWTFYGKDARDPTRDLARLEPQGAPETWQASAPRLESDFDPSIWTALAEDAPRRGRLPWLERREIRLPPRERLEQRRRLAEIEETQ